MPVITFKVDEDSASRIRQRARLAKTSVSAYLRQVALGDDSKPLVRVRRRAHPVSGLPCNTAANLKPVSEEVLRAALAEYP